MTPLVLLALASLIGLAFFADGAAGAVVAPSGAGADPAGPIVGATPPAGAPPAATPPAEPTSAGISLDQVVRARTKGGDTVEVPIRDLYTAWQERPDPARVELLGLLEKAVVNNDADAARQIVSRLAPTTPAAPATPPGQNPPTVTGDPRIDQLLKENAEIKQLLAQKIGPTVDAVREAGLVTMAAGAIEANKAALPVLTRRADGATIVARHARSVAKQNGIDFDSLAPHIRQQALGMAVTEVEANLTAFMTSMGLDPKTVFAPPVANNGRGNIFGVDDQNRNVPEDKVIQPRYRANPVTGQLELNTTATGTLPATPINGAPGGAPGAAPVTGGGRMTTEQTIAAMKAKRGALV